MSSFKPGQLADERAPLLSNGGSSSGHNGLIEPPSNHSNLYNALFNPHHTPGQHSDSFAVRTAVYPFHVAKVTLLSSM